MSDISTVVPATDGSIIGYAIAIVAIVMYMLDKILPYIKSKNGHGHGRLDSAHEQILKQVSELHKWHDREDPLTGRKLWYERADMVPLLQELNTNIQQQTRAFDELSDGLKETIEKFLIHESVEETSFVSIAKSLEKLSKSI